MLWSPIFLIGLLVVFPFFECWHIILTVCNLIIWDQCDFSFNHFPCRKWIHCIGFGRTSLETFLSLLCITSSKNLRWKMHLRITIMGWSAFSGSIGIVGKFYFDIFTHWSFHLRCITIYINYHSLKLSFPYFRERNRYQLCMFWHGCCYSIACFSLLCFPFSVMVWRRSSEMTCTRTLKNSPLTSVVKATFMALKNTGNTIWFFLLSNMYFRLPTSQDMHLLHKTCISCYFSWNLTKTLVDIEPIPLVEYANIGKQSYRTKFVMIHLSKSHLKITLI